MKLNKIWALSAVTIALMGCNNEQSQPQSKTKQVAQTSVSKTEKIKKLALETYTLDNGLEVVLHQDKSDPVVAVAIQYKVGSSREVVGKTGFAHFFEHMLFQNSEHVGAGNFIKNIGNMGGVLNGGTWQDGTIYYESFPSDGLEKVLWMESDRMGYFINTVTQQGLENEKQVVKNEKRQSIDNRPYGHTRAVTLEALYPKGHPYSWDVIGSLKDLQNATLQDVRDFYQKWYGVNNATLVLAGDFDSTEAKAWIKKYFGEFKARGDVTPLGAMPVSLTSNKSIYHEDNFATLPELTITLPTVEHYSKESYALSILAELLSDGKDSVLYKQVVVADKLAPSVSAYNRSSELAGVFSLKVRAFNDVDLDKVKASLDTALQNFAKNGFTEAQLNRVLTKLESAFYGQLTSVSGKASGIARHTAFAGDPALVATEIERFRQVTSEDVLAVFNKYILNKHSIATSFVPKGKLSLALDGATKANIIEEKIVQGAEQKMAQQGPQEQAKPAPVVQATSSFDRSVMPKSGQLNPVQLPDVKETTLDNGLQVLSIEHNELPLVSFSIRIKGGHLLDRDNKDGTANLLATLLMQGTASKTPKELEKALGDIGAQFTFRASGEFITLSGSVLTKHFAKAMSLAQEIILEPRWDEVQWQRVVQETKAKIQQAAANPGAIAQTVFSKLVYGEQSKLASPVTGTLSDVENITLDDLKAYYNANVVSSLTTLHVAGDLKQAEILANISALKSNMNTAKIELPKVQALPKIAKPQLYFVDVPGAKQSFLRLGNPAMVANADDYYQTVAVNHNLGGSFSGQLFQILRLQKGYTYGAYSGVSRENAGGIFAAHSSVRSNVTLESLQTFKEILANYGNQFDQMALENTQSVLKKSNALAFETTGSLLSVLENISSYNLPTDYVENQQKALNSMTLLQAKQAISNYINPDKMIYLVVGDANTQLPRMKELALGEAILLDKQGNKL